MQAALTSVVLVVIVLGALILAASGIWWFTPLASNWNEIDGALLLTLAVIGLAFVVLNIVLAYLVLRYRYREQSRAHFLPDNPKLEKILIGITALGIVILLAPGLLAYSRFISPPRDALTIEVLGEQWRWSYRYPGPDGKLGRANPKLISPKNPFGVDLTDPAALDDILSYTELHLPVGRPVVLHIRSKDVIHSFFIPSFRAKMDAVPGMVTHYWFIPTVMGRFQAVCAELCGIGHHRMQSPVLVERVEDFQQWLAKQPTVAATVKP
ncbi:MAG: cytochrome c oxidase subunit II [Candidatus Bipolaricaulota bacterium]|nr:cytochrome c oxidase subunit II [Candidatus Bipolaricaulota bacterium]